MDNIWVSADGVGVMPDTWYSLSLDNKGALKVEEVPEPDFACGGVEVTSVEPPESPKERELRVAQAIWEAREARLPEDCRLPYAHDGDAEPLAMARAAIDALYLISYCVEVTLVEPDMMSAVRDIARGS